MTRIKEQCVYAVGPYKGYCGRAQYDQDSGIFHGEVVGVRDVVTFRGTTPTELRAAFSESVDDYLDFCSSRNESPEKPFSGKLLTRMDPELHKKISMAAELSGVSLNQFICDSLGKTVGDSLLSDEISRASSRKATVSGEARARTTGIIKSRRNLLKKANERTQHARRHRKVKARGRSARMRSE